MEPKKIAEDSLEYLVFEGGGGAGNAYPGALMALFDLGLLESPQIRGFAGSSAGAINSLFLSLGYNCFEINYILKNQDFTEFFDDLKVSFVPRVGGCRLKEASEYAKGEQEEIAGGSLAYAFEKSAVVSALNLLNVRLAGYELFGTVVLAVLKNAAYTAADLMTTFNPSMNAIVDRIRDGDSSDQIYLSLKYDWGLFSGDAIRKFFEKWIYVAVYRALGRTIGSRLSVDPRQLTFEQHYLIFKKDLIVTGSNLETGKTELFSQYSTPAFPVADAVRISMSLPLAYKPMVIRSSDKLSLNAGAKANSFLEGVWVDGGLFNNNPVEVFDQIAGSFEKTLSLRLRSEERTNIADWKGFYSVYPCGMAKGTGESQLSGTLSPWLNRFVTLEVSEDEMGLLDFAVSTGTFDTVNQRSYMSVMAYFGEEARYPEGYAGDWEDPSQIGQEVVEYADRDLD